MSKSELLSCPFCGSDNVEMKLTLGDLRLVECGSCFAHGPPMFEPADAVAAWNERKTAKEVEHE